MLMNRRLARLSAAAIASLFASTAVHAQVQRADHPGRAVYEQYCAACHNLSGTRAPALSAMQQMSAQTLRFALTEGVMAAQGSMVPREQFQQLIGFLAAGEVDKGDWVAGMMCKADQRTVDLTQPASLTMFGTDYGSSRKLTSQQAGLTSADMSNLELAWAIGFPNTTSLRSSPVIIGSTMFYAPTPTGKLIALDTKSACVKWAYDAGVQLRSSVTYGELGKGGPKALVFGDARGQIHTVDAKTGALIWKAEGRGDGVGSVTGAPLLYKDRIIIPVSASGVGAGANPNFECCTGHGKVVALEAATGKQLWVYHTMEEAKYTGKTTSNGVKLRGPSGAPIWSTPSIDEKRGVVYAATGQATSLPLTKTSDAIIAIDLATGQEKWVFQAIPNDVWHMGCADPKRLSPSCPSPEESVLKDYDFGAAVVIAKNKDGQDVLLAGQKSGDVWALDPDQNGKVLWNQRFGTGTPLGGVHWGLAIDGERVFAPINDPHFTEMPPYEPQPGMNAIDITTGKVLWRKPVTADCTNGRDKAFAMCGEKYGLSAAPLVVDKSVIAAAIDGRVYVYDTVTGNVQWQFDTLREFNTSNGVTGKGGAIDSHSIFAGDGMVFVASGYGAFRQAPGNVLLAFRPKKK